MIKQYLTLVVAIMLTNLAYAENKDSGGVTPNLDQGTTVLDGSGYLNLMGDDLHIQLAYGRLVVDNLEVALVAGLRDSEFYMSTELGVRAEYNFVFGSPFVPFLSASAVWASVESDASNIDADAAVFSVGAGAKYFLQNNVALALSGNYLMATDDIFVDNDDGKAQDDEFRILFSIRFYW
jgi:opacity protein-like surface antigen